MVEAKERFSTHVMGCSEQWIIEKGARGKVVSVSQDGDPAIRWDGHERPMTMWNEKAFVLDPIQDKGGPSGGSGGY